MSEEKTFIEVINKLCQKFAMVPETVILDPRTGAIEVELKEDKQTERIVLDELTREVRVQTNIVDDNMFVDDNTFVDDEVCEKCGHTFRRFGCTNETCNRKNKKYKKIKLSNEESEALASTQHHDQFTGNTKYCQTCGHLFETFGCNNEKCNWQKPIKD